MTPQQARKKWRGYPETLKVVLEMLALGWRLQERGNNHVTGFCPHGHPERGAKPLQIYSTPQNDGRHARRLRREASACPSHHERLDAR